MILLILGGLGTIAAVALLILGVARLARRMADRDWAQAAAHHCRGAEEGEAAQ
jgi:hypothetical protein